MFLAYNGWLIIAMRFASMGSNAHKDECCVYAIIEHSGIFSQHEDNTDNTFSYKNNAQSTLVR